MMNSKKVEQSESSVDFSQFKKEMNIEKTIPDINFD